MDFPGSFNIHVNFELPRLHSDATQLWTVIDVKCYKQQQYRPIDINQKPRISGGSCSRNLLDFLLFPSLRIDLN